MQEIIIDGGKYRIVDAREYMTIPDCFVLKNKIGKGHGEAKFYVGNENEETMTFFDDFDRKCIFVKSDFIKYLDDAKYEYQNPEQDYKNRQELGVNWEEYMKEVNLLPSEVIEFSIFRSEITPPRVYINSDDEIYSLLRKIALPQISYLSALKLQDERGNFLYYFKPFIDYHYFGDDEHPSLIEEEVNEINKNEEINTEVKVEIKKARIGQGEYRKNLLQECPVCLITGVTDERLLIASHIKPWAHSNNIERIDPRNGLIFTPTYDALFDKGFISFNDDGSILISPWISPMNQNRLRLSPRIKCDFNIDGREIYLEYHRKNIFKG